VQRGNNLFNLFAQIARNNLTDLVRKDIIRKKNQRLKIKNQNCGVKTVLIQQFLFLIFDI